ncbi:hypothetical protein ACFV0Q_40280, partial [Streptomyces sp. NPDC059564]
PVFVGAVSGITLLLGTGALAALHRDLDCWRNLWRATDPIGGPVDTVGADGEPVDRGPLRDPLGYGRSPRYPLPAPILRHGDYQADPAFNAERDALLARLAAAARGDVHDPRDVPGQRISAARTGPADPQGTAG